jgi:hypothetical protein
MVHLAASQFPVIGGSILYLSVILIPWWPDFTVAFNAIHKPAYPFINTIPAINGRERNMKVSSVLISA